MSKVIKKLILMTVCFALVICNVQGIHISSAAQKTTTLSVDGQELYNEAYKILEIVNKERKAKGLSVLSMDVL